MKVPTHSIASRREYLGSLLIAIGMLLFGDMSTLTAASPRPNILVILADDLGYSDLGCYGGEINTPHLNELAGNGVRFTQFYNSARCCPSRASLMTGLYPSQAGIGDFTTGQPHPTRGPGYLGRLNDQCVTLAEVLKPAGYACYYVGKWHLNERTGPIQRGFDEFYGFTRGHSHDQYDASYYVRLPEGRPPELKFRDESFYATDAFNEYALEFIRQGTDTGQPWFLFLGHSAPHFPIQVPPERADKYDATYRRGWDALREERFRRMKRVGLVNGPHWTFTSRSLVPLDRADIANGYPGVPNPAWDTLPESRQFDLARRMAVFAAMVETVDAGVGRIVEQLHQTNQLENTLILFLSDNGACYEWGPFGFDGRSRDGDNDVRTGTALREIGGPGTHQSYGSGWANLGNTPLRFYKHFTHEGGISTPLIAHWPAGLGRPDRWVRQPAHLIDILPTLLKVAEAEYPTTFQDHEITPLEGVNLLDAMRGATLPERFLGFDHEGARALRQGDWKIVWPKRVPGPIEWKLYNLASDRCEVKNRAAEFPERVAAMAKLWESWAARVHVVSEAPHVPDARSAPVIQNRPLTIQGKVRRDTEQGVIVAQGGQEFGYAVHLLDGRLAFDVRINGQVTRITSADQVAHEFQFVATLSENQMTLSVDGKQVAGAHSPGLITTQPQDPLDVGRDNRTAAGDYAAPNHFVGQVLALELIVADQRVWNYRGADADK